MSDTNTDNKNDIVIPEYLMEQPEANQLDLKTSEWEELMIDDLVNKLDVSEDTVLTIMSNILTNEVQAKYQNKECMLNDIEAYFVQKYKALENKEADD